MYFTCEITQKTSQYKYCLKKGEKNEKQKEKFNKES